ncbi:60Kd inner membrane protein-domain-containing protein [Desarmillaria tabescens]|uniref:60Kd inner membrane protein-domain-containing protein n=1 Tax=Armillaria tabescens TaxID=1929756 RepID=A0AA39NCQ7_ARMTA|nr:60Kd inner membrane protein-domain-containing protein [Desarmillaria tabescens]KAK0463240.1 60Kd inner membrane protein-domain-containing protein [Desarmillaria tabescens]
MIRFTRGAINARLYGKRTPHARLLPSLTQSPSLKFERQARIASPVSRNFSLWPSFSSKNPTPPPPEPPAADVADANIPTEEVLPSTPSEIFAFPETIPSDIVETTTAVIAPLQPGDLASMGLAAYTPVGAYQSFLEYLNYTTGLPWLWTIVAGAAIMRTLVIPFTIGSMKQTALMPLVNKEVMPLRDEMQLAAASGDRQRQMQVYQAMRDVQKKHGISLGKTFSGIFSQMLVSISAFLGVNGMCKLPVPQLTQSGVSWVTDLTALPPTELSVAFASTVLLQTLLASREQDPNDPRAITMKIFTAIAPVLSYWGITHFEISAGTVVSMFAFSFVHITQTVILQIAPIRALVGLPPLPSRTKPKILEEIPVAPRKVQTPLKSRH